MTVTHCQTTKDAVHYILMAYPERKMTARQIAVLATQLKLVPGLADNTTIKNIHFLREDGIGIDDEYVEERRYKRYWLSENSNMHAKPRKELKPTYKGDISHLSCPGCGISSFFSTNNICDDCGISRVN